MRHRRTNLTVAVASCCALVGGAVIISSALAAKKEPTTPIVPQGKAGIQENFERELAAALNKARKARKLHPLRGSNILRRAAREHSMFMAQTSKLQHAGRKDEPFYARFVRHGYDKNARMSEVIAKRNVCKPGDPELIVKEWIASPRHYVLMFDAKIRYFGSGVVSKSGCALTFYTLDFGS